MSKAVITRYTVNTGQRLSEPVRIAQVSDLHERNCDDILSMLKVEKPDVIMVTGDTFERYDNRPQYEFEHRPLKRLIINTIHYSNYILTKFEPKRLKADEENVLRFLREAVKTAPVYMSLGNHEQKLMYRDYVFLKQQGITLLDNADMEMEVKGFRFLLGGMSCWDFEEWFPTYCEKDGYKILLCHKPNQYLDYAEEKGIKMIGDIPIYVAMDSADVWAEPHFFQLDERNVPKEIAGVPPDAFTEDGQLWGNPLYDWERMKADGYGWWIRRIEGATRLYDVLRIDHFRGLESYWAVPYGDTTAKNGKWRPGPGMSLVGVLTSWFHGTEFIAEDLGYLTPGVRKLLKDSGLPGMKVMEFAFDAHEESDYLPHRCGENSICYLGTHDNDTVLGWLETTGKADRDFARRYMHITPGEGWCWGMIRSGMATQSRLFVVQMQDLLELDGGARMNVPGKDSGNWQWRMLPGAADRKLAEKLRLYTETFRRTEQKEQEE